MEAAEPRSRRKRSAIRSSQDDSSSTTSKESISPRSKKTDEPVGVLDDKRLLFQEKVRLSNEACQEGDFKKAVQLYSEALILDPANHILFSNRSAANIKLKEYENALQDANKAKDLNPKWSKAYYRQGVALQCLGRHADALAAFASGLAQDPKSLQLQGGLIEATLKSPLKEMIHGAQMVLSSEDTQAILQLLPLMTFLSCDLSAKAHFSGELMFKSEESSLPRIIIHQPAHHFGNVLELLTGSIDNVRL